VREQVPFYRYLNQHFFIILCRRDNLFEHALSWALNKITGKLNVYTAQDKIASFFSVFKQGVTLDPLSIKQSLDAYQRYVEWGERYFRAAAYYHYERDMPNIESYVLSLPIFAGQPRRVTWQDVYGQAFTDWNRCHYLSSDIGSVARLHRSTLLSLTAAPEPAAPMRPVRAPDMEQCWQQFQTAYEAVADPSWPRIYNLADWQALPQSIRNECLELHHIGYHLESALIGHNVSQGRYSDPALSGSNLALERDSLQVLQDTIGQTHSTFLAQHQDRYQQAAESITRMVELGIMPNSVPIKKQTLQDKRTLIRNFDQCVDTYNEWISRHPDLGDRVTDDGLLIQQHGEKNLWQGTETKKITG
jgi:hypothetical protein